MSRPVGIKETRKAKQELINERDLYRLMRQDEEIKLYGLTMEQIRAVFRAYSKIVFGCTKNKVRVSLPYLGEAFYGKVKGFKGGDVRVPDEGQAFKKGGTWHTEYRPPKPDYGVIRIEIRKSIQDKFKAETLDG